MKKPLRIAVASGKGGTGKTTIATSLALSLRQPACAGDTPSAEVLFLDCDVEGPNAHLFLKPLLEQRQEIGLLIPQVDEARCTHCGKCAEVCQYHAIAVLGKKVLVFPQLCHGCGSCTWNCPEQAISEKLNKLGLLERGPTPAGIEFGHGILDVGEPMAVPVIRQLKQWVEPRPDQIVILDSPPGTSCPVVEAVRQADFLLLVSEPTPFGLHDLRLAVQIARELDIPAGVVINRYQANSTGGPGYPAVEEFCAESGLPVLLRIPFERRIAEGIARGKDLLEIHPEFIPLFQQLLSRIAGIVEASK